ncbi:MAG: fumarylacetoacetate hydrolase family protein [Sphingobacterium sp.]|uniref:fumarylacetoacetate hydrolase family protein n=1 Tax=Sphingobacterium sp. JB170 TaxID=1434842 RepID=UPI00097F42FF|nr:fumarylacetoacetate hydrolase family protein [Sphingobacterium sp. JB170]SJN48290.1 2-hydroxyhepta-2,4-diene-1,7-dioate isomerase / 5-carboxymethyl-2-oxo-hex-3-ene-1,7-dioate decarboxylase [Sphingobacterium sp. JB170]
MKLVRFGELGNEQIGVQIEGVSYDVSAFGGDYDEQFFEQNGLARLENFVKANQGKLLPIADGIRIGAPIARPSKIVCIGLNYKDHAEETGAAIPTEPIIFMKSTTALVGPNDNVVIPKNSTKTDWEVEFAIVMGKKASYVEKQEALDYVAGYVLHNDVSERAFQFDRGGTWDKGKGCDTFAPLGPVLTTKDEIPNINNVRLWLKVNGKSYQDGNTSNLIFSVEHVVSYVSQFMTLLPGDVISTGTPAGVGLGFNPPIYLKPGDVVELGADHLGESRQECVAYIAPQ